MLSQQVSKLQQLYDVIEASLITDYFPMSPNYSNLANLGFKRTEQTRHTRVPPGKTIMFA